MDALQQKSAKKSERNVISSQKANINFWLKQKAITKSKIFPGIGLSTVSVVGNALRLKTLYRNLNRPHKKQKTDASIRF